ncbi:hypothetical protein C8A05DRAFT_30208 [Staphylotrichum tortipilum]|uniref:Uncharacterized protein n=1 Tax=Staphylotrichum tortipilum TaxID=2831512 RepID=A0AAN6MSS7_9PEZI|nr:hypothetical protein C8A05DRAFT_30208 [Staphylotrichum longicolle]
MATAPILHPRTRVVTQTLTRPFTTITTLVTLGDGPTPFPTTTDPPPTPPPTTTTTAAAAPIPVTPSPSTSLTPHQLGALLGTILGAAFALLLICLCLTLRRKRHRHHRHRHPYDYDGDYYSASESDVVRVRASMSTWPRSGVREGTWTAVPPPVRFPPTPSVTASLIAIAGLATKITHRIDQMMQ